MKPEHQIIYRIISRFFMPTSGHVTEPGRMQLYLLYCVLEFIPISFGYIFVHVWRDWIKAERQNRKIPFGSLLTNIFTHSQCPFHGSFRHAPKLTLQFLELQSIKLHNGTWYRKDEYKRLFGPTHQGASSSSTSLAQYDEIKTRFALMEALHMSRLTSDERNAYAALKAAHNLSPPHTLEDQLPEQSPPIPSPERAPSHSPTPPPPPPKRARTKVRASKKKKKDKGESSKSKNVSSDKD